MQDSLKTSLVTRPSASLTPLPVVRIRPTQGWASLQLRDLWEYRELLFFLTWRDIKVRYQQTILGVAWAIIQPVITMVVFSFFFGNLAKMDSDGIPYPIFSFAALVPWSFFASSLTQASTGMVTHANLIKKVYFPRLAIPIARVMAGLVDFFISFTVLLIIMFAMGLRPTENFVWLPLFLLLAVITALGVGLWFAAMNVQFRDIAYTVPFIVQLWMFVTPVVYSSNLIAERYGVFWQTVYGLNPMAGVVEGFRWALLGVNTAPQPIVYVSALVAIVVLVSGAFYFRRMERTFADVV